MTHGELVEFFGKDLWKEIPGSAKHKIDLLRRRLVHKEMMRIAIDTKTKELEERVNKVQELLDRIQGVETP